MPAISRIAARQAPATCMGPPSRRGLRVCRPQRSKQKILKACETLRIAPVPSPSPFPQPSRERRSFARVGLLAYRVFCLLPAPSHPPPVSSGFCGFRPHSQRRDREGITPSSLHPETFVLRRHSMGACGALSSSNLSVLGTGGGHPQVPIGLRRPDYGGQRHHGWHGPCSINSSWKSLQRA